MSQVIVPIIWMRTLRHREAQDLLRLISGRMGTQPILAPQPIHPTPALVVVT